MPSTIRGSDNFDSGRFESAEQTITVAGALTIPHGLGVKPFMVQCELICKTAEYGYSIGDKLQVQNGGFTSSGISQYGMSLVADATNIAIRYGATSGAYYILDKTSGMVAVITTTNWKLIVKAIA